MMAQTDNELMRRAGQGELPAYRQLVVRHLSRSVGFAQRMLGSRADAEDVVQDVFLKVWEQAPSWRPRAAFSTWLYRVLYNACLDHKRKVVPFAAVEMEQIEDSAPSPASQCEQSQQVRQVQKALAVLPERQRAALVLSYYDELSNQAAAEVMGVALGAFQQLLFRARQALREKMVDEPSEKRNGRTG